MSLSALVGTENPADIDSNRAIRLGDLELGSEAAAEVCALLPIVPNSEISLIDGPVDQPFYWSVFAEGLEVGEAFGFPNGYRANLPTAVEIGIVRALHRLSDDQNQRVLVGGCVIIIGRLQQMGPIPSLLAKVARSIDGGSVLRQPAGRIDFDPATAPHRGAERCLEASLAASPLKFRFLELYRALEGRLLSDILAALNAEFITDPRGALERGLSKMKAEIDQLAAHAKSSPGPYEAVFDLLKSLKGSNSLAAAFLAKLDDKHAKMKSPKSAAGAAFLYFLRCSIVHAGEKDLIFENFSDAEDLLQSMIPYAETVALGAAGITLS